jgi:hypothetical protein
VLLGLVKRVDVELVVLRDEEQEQGGELLPARELQEPPPELVVGQDLPVGVDHHLRDRVLLLGEDPRAALALERRPDLGDQPVKALL